MIDEDSRNGKTQMRKRGIERFNTLLDATAALLSELPDEDISLAQIADRAAVPLASLYHFFPNRNAAFVALAKRYHVLLNELALSEPEERPARWQDVIEYKQRNGARFLNDNPAAQRLFLGAGVSVEVRNTDLSGNAELARNRAEYLNRMFEIPKMPDLEKRLAVSIAVMDGIWALSYSIHRSITDEYLEESILTSTTYLRCYLPEFLQPKL